jgi:hypothetical protein
LKQPHSQKEKNLRGFISSHSLNVLLSQIKVAPAEMEFITAGLYEAPTPSTPPSQLPQQALLGSVLPILFVLPLFVFKELENLSLTQMLSIVTQAATMAV